MEQTKDSEIKTSETLVQFKVQIVRFTKVNKCSAFNLRDPISKEILARLYLYFTQLN